MVKAIAFLFACVALIALQSGCVHPRYYDDAELSFGTEGHFESQGHFAVYYPNEIALGFPGYVVGIELSDNRTRILRRGDLVVDRLVHAGASMTRLTDVLADGFRSAESPNDWDWDPLPFISHVIRFKGQPMGAGNCALYSVYQSPVPELMGFCDGQRRPRIDDWPRYRSAFADSWSAIDALKDALHADAASGKYTHLIVAMMGWRTTQEEAIRNFNSLYRSLLTFGKDDFRPLFVGITWVGPWSGRWLDPLMEMASYGNIADLADTLGLTWVGVLADEVVLPVSGQLATTFITHSFGARAASTAICIGPAIRRTASDARTPVNGSVDRLIGFEAAFSLQRFKKGRLLLYEDVHFPNDCDRVKSIVLTTSEHDTAAKAILWADLAGNYRYFKSFCRSNSETIVKCTSVDETGAIEDEHDGGKRLLYLDATRLIRFKAPGTDGGSHSDIFRLPAGRLIWDLISQRPAGAGQAASRP